MGAECEITQLVRWSEGEVFKIDIQVLPWPSATTVKPFSWFADKENQELLALVYDTIISETSSRTSSLDYHTKRSQNLRILFKFKPVECKQHLVIPEHRGVLSGLIPQAAFISDEGKKVLPFLYQRTESSGYRSFRIHSNCMEVYVDRFPVTDSRGIFQVLKRMDPYHSVNTDITSYFLSPSSEAVPALDSVCSLSEIPTATVLKPRQLLTRKKESGSRGGLMRKSSRVAPKTKGAVQGTIQGMLKRTAAVASAGSTSEECIELTEEAFKEFCDFGSQDMAVQDKGGVLDDENTPVLRHCRKDRGSSASNIKDRSTSTKDRGSIASSLKDRGISASSLKDRGSSASSLKDRGSIASSLKDRGSSALDVTERAVTPPSAPNDHFDLDETPPLWCNDPESPRRNCRKTPMEFGVVEKRTPRKDLIPSTSIASMTANYDTMILEVSGLSDVLTPDISISSVIMDSIVPCDTTACGSKHSEKDSTRCLVGNKNRRKKSCGVSCDSTPSWRKKDRSKKKRKLDSDSSTDEELRGKNIAIENSSDEELNISVGTRARKRRLIQSSTDEDSCMKEDATGQKEESGCEDSTDVELCIDEDGGGREERSDNVECTGEASGTSSFGAGGVVDLTDLSIDSGMVVIDSDTDCLSGNTKSSQSAVKRKKLKNSKEIFEGAECVADLSTKQLSMWMYLQKPLLVDIFKRMVFSRRHEDYVSGSHKKRAALKHQVDTRMFSSEQLELVTKLLLHIFCGRHKKYFAYVMDVLLSECVIRIIADVYKVGFDEAEEMMKSYDPSAS